MIARITIPLLLMILLADIHIDQCYLRKLKRHALQYRLLLWLPSTVMLVATVTLSLQRDFAPHDTSLFNIYLFLLGLIVVPLFVFVICSVIGLAVRRILHIRRNYGKYVGLALVIALWYILFYGTFVGFNKLNIRHIDYSSTDLPAVFNGYRIVQFSDAHVGTYDDSRQHLLAAAIDTINAQHADAIMFVGDLQNMEPSELTPHINILSSLRAKDGVFSVLGNHDYAIYIDADDSVKAHICQAMIERQRQMGWTLLRNEHHTIRRGSDSIVVAGMENYGTSSHAPKVGDVTKTMNGVSKKAFTVMMQHDPTAWKAKILPESDAQLTLSGHTHAMQFELFGWSPASFIYKEWGGTYYSANRALNISTGLGGFVPFRFGVPGEIVVITLHSVHRTRTE